MLHYKELTSSTESEIPDLELICQATAMVFSNKF